MNQTKWLRYASKTSFIVAGIAIAALAFTSACGKSDGNDNNPRITMASMAGGYAQNVASGGAVQLTIVDPSNNNLPVTIVAPVSTNAQWGNQATMNGRAYNVETIGYPNTNQVGVMLAWAPIGASAPTSARAYLLTPNGTGALTIQKQTGATSGRTDIGHFYQDMFN